jgi:hypothetical protein
LINRKIIISSFLAALFGASFYFTYQYLQPFQKVKIKERELRIKPNVTLDPAKQYQITLWDYDWPLRDGNYHKYLQEQIRVFNQSYPNITVQLRLLDLLTGPGELAEALRKGQPPDVYCSALATPKFDFKYQTPVGPYQKPKTSETPYLPGIKRLTEIDGVQCYFPRWARPSIWVGNRQLLERAGLSIVQIQTRGWSWEEVLGLRAQLPSENYLLVGKVIPETVLQKIGTLQGLTNRGGAEWGLLQKIRDAKGVSADGNLKMVEYFLNGRAAVLVGVTPLIWRNLKERLAHSGAAWEAVCLPTPNWRPGKPQQTVELGVISVYRRPRLGGDAQVAAAMKLGEYLSLCRGADAPWTEMMFIPAASAAAARWFQKTAPESKADGSLRVLEQELSEGNLRLAAPCQVKLGRIAAVAQKFLTGALSQSETIERMRMELSAQ